MSVVVVAGQAVADEVATLRRKTALPLSLRSGFSKKDLWTFEQEMAQAGYVEAEVIRYAFGYSVRYASGLNKWALIFSAQAKQVDGTLEDAIRAAREWQEADPNRRWVTRWASLRNPSPDIP